MDFLLLFDSFSGFALLGISCVYAIVCLYLFYCTLFRSLHLMHLHRIIIAFFSFFLITIQQTLLYGVALNDGVNIYPLSQLSIKLFIFTTLFVLLLYQASGFVVDTTTLYVKYLSLLYCAILFVDIFSIKLELSQCYYNVLLSGIMIGAICLLLSKFLKICIDRYEFIKESVSKDNFICVLKTSGIFFIALSIVFISVIPKENEFICIFSLLTVISLHLLYIYYKLKRAKMAKVARVAKVVKEYIEADSNGANGSECLEMLEDKCTDYQTIINRLILYFESEKPYLDRNLKMADVSKRIYTNKTYVSRAMNHGMSKNFNQFVNYYRIKEACTIFLEDPLISIAELCDRCGFKNLSSFSNAFNLNVGYTPAEWCKIVRKKLNNNEKVSLGDYFP